MRKVVGISQRIKRAWLDATLDRLVTTTNEAELRSFLDKHLKSELPGTQSRAKTAGIIMQVWSSIAPDRSSLRDRALALLPRISGQERIWLHWGMTALAYPYFRDAAEVIGRLLALQDDFTTAQVQGRMATTWGDRATSKDATQKLLNTLVDWEVLRSTKVRGHFLLARKMRASTPDLQLWLLEAMLAASAADEVDAQQLLRLPESFPFTLDIGISHLRRHDGFNIHRQGLDTDMVAIRTPKPMRPAGPAVKQKVARTPTAEPTGLFNGKSANGHLDPAGLHAVSDSPSPVVRQVEQPESNGHTNGRSGIPTTNQPETSPVPVIVPVPDNPFAAAVFECGEHLRNGLYFGCVALASAVIEAILRRSFPAGDRDQTTNGGRFDEAVLSTFRRPAVNEAMATRLRQTWFDRRSLYQLSPAVASDYQKLREEAQSAFDLLNRLVYELVESGENIAGSAPGDVRIASHAGGQPITIDRG